MLVSDTTTFPYCGDPFSIVTVTIEEEDAPVDFDVWFKEWRAEPGVARRFRIDIINVNIRNACNVVITSDLEYGAFMMGWALRGMFEHPGK